MAARQKSFRDEHASDEIFDFECGPCKFDGNILEANGFCSNCSEYLCDLCFRTHLKPMPCRNHILLDASQMPWDKSAAKAVDVGTVRCEKHAVNVIEYYCSTHVYLGCITCIKLEHRACEGVSHISSITKELYETQEYVEFKQSINSVVKSTAHNGLEIKRNTTETERIYTKTKKEIKQYRKEIDLFIDNLENKIDTELSKLNDNYISMLQEATDSNKSLEKEITTVSKEVTKREKQAKRIDSFVYMTRTKGSLLQCNKKADEVLDKLKVRSYSFQNEFDKHKPALKGLFGSIVEEVTTKQKHSNGGGWASSQGEIDYSEKLMFSDEEDEGNGNKRSREAREAAERQPRELMTHHHHHQQQQQAQLREKDKECDSSAAGRNDRKDDQLTMSDEARSPQSGPIPQQFRGGPRPPHPGGWQMTPFDFLGPRGHYPPHYRMGMPPQGPPRAPNASVAQKAPFTGGAPQQGSGPAAPMTPTTPTKKGEDDDELWRQRRQERNTEVSNAIERARQRREEEEKRFVSDRRKAAQEKLKALNERTKKKDNTNNV